MPAYNAARFIRPAIESVLRQSFEDLELILIDDASTDGTLDIVRSFSDPRLIILRNPRNLGAAAALNRGLETARGPLIARQDADDLSHPDRLAIQVDTFDRQPDLVILGSSLEFIDAEDRLIRVLPRPESDTAIRWRMLFQNAFGNSSVMFQRSALGPLRYDPAMIPSEDYAFWSRLIERGKAANLPQPLARYRVHPAQISSVRATNQRNRSDEIASRNLARLGVDLTNEELRIVRDWAFSAPRSLARDEIPKYARSLEIMRAFSRNASLDPIELETVHRNWARQALAALPARRLHIAWKAGILPAVLTISPGAALAGLARRALRRVRRRGAARGGVA